jgi:hypothetical protein
LDEKRNSPREDHPAGGSVEEEVIIFCPPFPGFFTALRAVSFF